MINDSMQAQLDDIRLRLQVVEDRRRRAGALVVLGATALVAVTVTVTRYVVAQQTAPSLRYVSYRGVLKSNGVAVSNGAKQMSFSLYDQPTGGTQIWGPEAKSVTVASGVFSANLGESMPLTEAQLQSTALWLDISVEGQALTPRQPLLTTPYAKDARTLRRALEPLRPVVHSTHESPCWRLPPPRLKIELPRWRHSRDELQPMAPIQLEQGIAARALQRQMVRFPLVGKRVTQPQRPCARPLPDVRRARPPTCARATNSRDPVRRTSASPRDGTLPRPGQCSTIQTTTTSTTATATRMPAARTTGAAIGQIPNRRPPSVTPCFLSSAATRQEPGIEMEWRYDYS